MDLVEIEAKVLAEQQPMNDAMKRGDSEVQKFYKHSVVFLTGGSGFLGKQLIEKLIRSCQISKVYMLLRSKKGKDFQERIQDMTKDPVFNTLWQQQPKFIEKIVAIEGDVASLRLGIKDENWKTLTEEVDVIFHVAATTRFDEPLRTATLINVRGTREAMFLGKACKKLRSYVHVSTAFSHATTGLIGGDIQEEFYETPIDPDTLISMAENAKNLNTIANDFIKDWPNNYTFTKAIAEEMVRTMSVGLPICIVRPAIVMGTYSEPSPGWLDQSCLYGVSGLIFGMGLGVFHVHIGDSDLVLAFIPCDYVNNAIIVAGRETASNQAKGGDDTKIYAVSTTHRNPATFRKIFIDVIEKEARKLMTPKSLYYAFVICTANRLLFTTLSLFLHILPAYLADFVCALLGKPRRFSKLAKKLYSMSNVISYFSLNSWNFVDNNLEKLNCNLSEQDKKIFNFDVTKIDWVEYTLVLCAGVRKYIFKDGLKNTEYAIRKQNFLKIVHYVIMSLCLYGIWKLIYLVFTIGSSLFTIVALKQKNC